MTVCLYSLVVPFPLRFFIFLLIMCSMSVFSACLFRTSAAFTRDEIISQAFNSLVLVLFMQNAGFTIARSASGAVAGLCVCMCACVCAHVLVGGFM